MFELLRYYINVVYEIVCGVFPEPCVETVEALEPKRNNYVGKTLTTL